MYFGEWVKNTGRTQVWVAAQLKISVEYTCRILKGRVASISPKLAAAIVALTDGQVTLQEALFPAKSLESADAVDGGV